MRETTRLSAFFPSIRWKIALLMGATVALTLLLICFGLIWQQNRESRALLSSDLQRASRLLSTRLDQLQDRTTRAARSVAVIPQIGPAIADGVTEIESTKLLQLLLPLTAIHDVTDIVVLDAKGKVVAGLRHDPPVLPGTVATEYRGMVLGSGGGKNELLLTTRIPLEADGKPAGAVVATMRLSPELMKSFRELYNVEASLVRRDGASGVRVVTSLSDHVGLSLEGSGVSVPASDGVQQLQDPPMLAHYAKSSLASDASLWLEVATPAAYLAELQARTLRTVVVLGIAGLAVGIGVSLVLARRITSPLRALRRAAEHLAEGDYSSEPIAVTSQDEVGYLARTFNEMSAALKERDERLQTFSRNLLQGQKALEYVNDRLKREKNEIETILNSVPEGVLVLEPQGYVINTNHAASLLMERRRSDILGHRPSELLKVLDAQGKPLDDVEPRLLERRTPVPGESLPSIEGFLVLHDDVRVPVEIDSVSVLDERKTYHGQVVIIRDITRKYEIDRLKEEFLAVITHQLKSPISALIGYAQILKESDGLSQENLDIIDNMKSLGEFLALQIGNILTSARLEAGRMSYRLEHFPVATSFRDLARLFFPVARTRGIHLVIEDVGDLFMYADIEKVHDILGNLINNALKFTPAGGTIRVAAEADDEFVHVRVSDTGKGIPADAQPRLFQKFYQVTGEGHGTGLGLYIARTMAEGMGGRIDMSSVVREGTTFTVTLPRGKQDQARRAAPSAPVVDATVLVVDGAREINAFVRLYLERQGVQHVRQAFSATDARVLIEKDPPDAIVLGEDLGDRTGWALALDLHTHEKTKNIPILYCTSTLKEDENGVFAAQLTRPLEPAALIEQLRAILKDYVHLNGDPGIDGRNAGRAQMVARATRVAEIEGTTE